MRHTKFRARSIETGEWVIGDLVGRTGYSVFSRYYIVDSDEGELELTEIESDTTGEYTGLKDKNRVEIFEGDSCGTGHSSLSPVVFRDGAFKWEQVDYRDIMESAGGPGGAWVNLSIDAADLEVVGNIHENPELLGPQS